MIRILFRYSQRLAGLILLASMVGAAASAQTPAQTKDKKAAMAEQPAGFKAPCCGGRTTKGAERIIETAKSPAQKPAGKWDEKKKIAVGEKTGGWNQPQEAIKLGKLPTRAGGGIGRVADQPDAQEEAKEGAGRVRRETGGGFIPAQKTKDATGSPQKAPIKTEPSAEIASDKDPNSLSRKRKAIEPAPEKPKPQGPVKRRQ